MQRRLRAAVQAETHDFHGFRAVWRRLAALERLAAGSELAECERLLALAASGRVAVDLVHLSDQQLWWLAVGACRPMPEGEALEAELQRIAAGGPCEE